MAGRPLAAGDVERLGRGVIATPLRLPDDILARVVAERALLRSAEASSLRCDRAVISHFAAAIADGMPTCGPLEWHASSAFLPVWSPPITRCTTVWSRRTRWPRLSSR